MLAHIAVMMSGPISICVGLAVLNALLALYPSQASAACRLGNALLASGLVAYVVWHG